MGQESSDGHRPEPDEHGRGDRLGGDENQRPGPDQEPDGADSKDQARRQDLEGKSQSRPAARETLPISRLVAQYGHRGPPSRTDFWHAGPRLAKPGRQTG